MITSNETTCQTTVYPKERWGSFHGHRCHRKVWKDGFCKQHHPETEESRRAESHKKFVEQLAKDPLKLALEKIKELEKKVESLEAQALEGRTYKKAKRLVVGFDSSGTWEDFK